MTTMNTINELTDELKTIMSGNLTPARAARASEIAYELTNSYYLGHWAHQCAADAHNRMAATYFRGGDNAARDAANEKNRMHRHLATDCYTKFRQADVDTCRVCKHHESECTC